MYRSRFFNTTPIVKDLIMINILMLLAHFAAESLWNLDLNSMLGIYFVASDKFMPIQFLTHLFMHGGIWHLFFNMYALYIFGSILEKVWGSKRFLLYYLVCGIGAAIVQVAVLGIQYHNLTAVMSSESVQSVLQRGSEIYNSGRIFTDPNMQKLQILLNTPTVGASGAIFGVLLAFGMLFPNTELMLLIPPIPIKAKWFVIIYGVIELVLAFSMPGSNVAHAAHIGGMIFGYFLIRYWRKRTTTFY